MATREQMDYAEKFTSGRGDIIPGVTKTTTEVLKAAKVAQGYPHYVCEGARSVQIGGEVQHTDRPYV